MLRRIGLFLLALSASAAGASCPDLPGAAALFAPSMPRIVWVGEMHGTNEMPALFADLVCIAGESGRKAVVLLEREKGEQANWDGFFASGDKARLTAGESWHSDMQDGRSSGAMVALAERLRDYKAAGRLSAVQLMQRPWNERASGNYRLDNETSMADAVKQAAQDYPDAVILIYSGGLHARKTMSPFDKDLPLAASLLPAAEVTSIDVIGQAGTAWNCFSSGCGVHDYYAELNSHPRGVTLGPAEEGYDGVAYTGQPTTASPPAVSR